MRRALAIDEQSLGPDHPPSPSASTIWRRSCKRRTGSPRRSRLMRRALSIDEHSLGPDHPRVAVGLNNLATLLQETNRLAEAEPLMRWALAIDEAASAPIIRQSLETSIIWRSFFETQTGWRRQSP